MVTLKFFANLRDIVHTKEIKVEGKNLKDAIMYAEKLLNVDLINELFENGKPKKGVIILVNGKNIEHLQGLLTPLSDGDVVSLFPPVGGG